MAKCYSSLPCLITSTWLKQSPQPSYRLSQILHSLHILQRKLRPCRWRSSHHSAHLQTSTWVPANSVRSYSSADLHCHSKRSSSHPDLRFMSTNKNGKVFSSWPSIKTFLRNSSGLPVTHSEELEFEVPHSSVYLLFCIILLHVREYTEKQHHFNKLPPKL